MMNFIQQAYKGKISAWKYLVPIVGFFGIVILNSVAIIILDLNVDEILRQQIEEKGANKVLFENMIPFVIFLAFLFIWVKFAHKRSLTSLTTSRSKIDWRRVFFSFSLWGAITIGLTTYVYFTFPEDFVLNFNLNKFVILAAISLLFIPLQTSFEEYFFRGYIMQALGVMTKNRWFPLFFTSITFGLMHMANPEVDKLGPIIMVYYIGTGFLLGIITLMDEGLELALGFHAANNVITALLITSDWTAFQTDSILKDISEPSVGFDILIPVLIIYPIILFVFSKKYGWENWMEKLFGKVDKPNQYIEDPIEIK